MFKFGTLFADILIVDAAPAFVRAVRPVLQAAGYSVRSVASGEKALEVVQTAPPDLVLLEIKLPDVDGCQVARRIKSDDGPDRPFIPIIVTTTTARETLAPPAPQTDAVTSEEVFSLDEILTSDLSGEDVTSALEQQFASLWATEADA